MQTRGGWRSAASRLPASRPSISRGWRHAVSARSARTRPHCGGRERRRPRAPSTTPRTSRTKDRPAVIVYTLVDTELRDTMRELCRRDRLHCCDLLGQPIEEVAAVSGKAARMEKGRRPPLDSQYFKRMEAIEFAVKFDDGLGTGLDDADIVLARV